MTAWLQALIQWLDAHQGSLMVLLTLVYVVSTVGILQTTAAATRLHRQSLSWALRPFVIIDLVPKDKYLYLRVRNCGSTPALDVSISWPERIQIHSGNVLPDVPLATDVPLLGPRDELTVFLDERDAFARNNPHRLLRADVSYTDLFGQHYRHEIRVLNPHT